MIWADIIIDKLENSRVQYLLSLYFFFDIAAQI